MNRFVIENMNGEDSIFVKVESKNQILEEIDEYSVKLKMYKDKRIDSKPLLFGRYDCPWIGQKSFYKPYKIEEYNNWFDKKAESLQLLV